MWLILKSLVGVCNVPWANFQSPKIHSGMPITSQACPPILSNSECSAYVCWVNFRSSVLPRSLAGYGISLNKFRMSLHTLGKLWYPCSSLNTSFSWSSCLSLLVWYLFKHKPGTPQTFCKRPLGVACIMWSYSIFLLQGVEEKTLSTDGLLDRDLYRYCLRLAF